MGWLIDPAIKDDLTSIDHKQIRGFLSRRNSDGGIHSLITKLLNAGVLEEGQMSYPDKVAPQGGDNLSTLGQPVSALFPRWLVWAGSQAET